jgi:TolA-binding protein
VPLSYLKQGLSLIEIGREEEAKLFFQTLIDKYPQSEEAKTAKEKIRELAVKR